MPSNAIYIVESNRKIAKDAYIMRLFGPTDTFVRPGQFVNVHVDGFYLRRPLAVCDWDEKSIALLYRVVGWGTARMAMYGPGTQLDLLAGLGNGFDLAPSQDKKTLLVGGGSGIPPLYALAKQLAAQGRPPEVALGFAALEEVFFYEEFQRLGCETRVATEDGSLGEKGYVTNLLKGLDYEYYYACGPQGMLAAVHALGGPGQLSFEERMGCGFGACMGCSCETLAGPKRICVEGPVLDAKEVTFG